MTQIGYPLAGTFVNIPQDWSAMAQNWLGTGVLKSKLNELQVYADSTGMQVKTKSGQAFMQGHFFQSDSEVVQPIANADPTNPRIDRIIIRLDYTSDSIQLAVLQGIPAASPTAPALTQNSTRWEISLAQVYVGANVTTIASGNITDERKLVENVISIDSTTVTRSTNYSGTQKVLFPSLANKKIKSAIIFASFNAGGINRASWAIAINTSGSLDRCIYSGVNGFAFDYFSIVINGATVNDYMRAKVLSFDIDGLTLNWEVGGGGLAEGSIVYHVMAIAN